LFGTYEEYDGDFMANSHNRAMQLRRYLLRFLLLKKARGGCAEKIWTRHCSEAYLNQWRKTDPHKVSLKTSFELFGNMEQFLRYTLKEKIGAGGMATVYRAEDTLLHRDVALKMLHPHLLDHKETILRFKNEARAIAAISHQNIVKIFDYGEGEGKRFLVMEYLDGQTLQALLDSCGTFSNLALLELLTQIFSGLQAAHEKGVYHRDIKPTNIIINNQGVVRIMDFGIAYLVNQESRTLTGTFMGSPGYISPEQAESRKVSGNTDIFSTGVLAYQAITGKMPFTGDNPLATIQSIVSRNAVRPFHHNPGILLWLSDFIEQCLLKDESVRPDAVQCLTTIRNRCQEDGLELGRKRLAEFIADRSACSEQECAYLFQTYRNKARQYHRADNTVALLKYMNQARTFGVLSREDERIALKIQRSRYFKRASLTAGIFAVIAGIMVYGFSALQSLLAPIGSLKSGSIANTVSATALSATTNHPKVAPARQAWASDLSPKTDTLQYKPIARPFAEDTPNQLTNHNGSVTPSASASSKRRGDAHPVAPPATAKSQKTTLGYAYVLTNPPWARISIDDIDLGLVPRREPFALKAGEHRLFFKKEGFPDISKMLTVVPAETITVRVLLTETGAPDALQSNDP
jgi:serine/threonine protein kinase